MSMAERAGVGRGALSTDPWGLRQKKPGGGRWSPRGLCPGARGWWWRRMEPLCQWSVVAPVLSSRCDPWGSEARPTPDGPLALGVPRSPRPPSGGGEAPVPRAGERRNHGRGHRRPAPAVSAAAVRAPLRNGPSHPIFPHSIRRKHSCR